MRNRMQSSDKEPVLRLARGHQRSHTGGRIGRMALALALGCAVCATDRCLLADPVIVEDDTPPDRPLLALDSGGHTGAVDKLAATGYGDQLISVSADKTIRFWDLATGEPVRVLRPPLGKGNFGYLFAVAVSPDGKLLAVAGYRAKRRSTTIASILLRCPRVAWFAA